MTADDAAVQPGGARRYVANATWVLTAEIASKVASFVFVVIVARSLGTRSFGYFSFALAFVPLFLVLGRAGIETSLVRELSREKERLSELVATGLALRISLALGGLAAGLAIAPLVIPTGRPYLVLVLVGFALLLDELGGFAAAVFLAFERMGYRAVTLLVNRFLSTALAVGAIAVGRGVVAVSAAYLVGSAVACLFAFWMLRRHFPPIDYRAVGRAAAAPMLRTGLPLGIASMLNAAVFRLDTVLLQAIKGPVEVAQYNVAYRFFESFLFVAWTLGTLALPRLSRAADRHAETAGEYSLAVALALAFYLPLAVMLPFAAHWLVTTVFSSRYANAASAVGVLAGAGVLYAIAYISRIALIALRRPRAVLVVAAVTVAASLALNVILIPSHGFVGAAWATLIAEIVEAALLAALFIRATGISPTLRPLAVPVLASAVLAAALGGSGWHGGGVLALACVVYPVALAAIALVVAPREIGDVRALLRRRA